MAHYQLQGELEEVSPSSISMHYRHNGDASFAQQLAESDDATNDKGITSDEEKEVIQSRDDNNGTGSGIYINTHNTHTANTHATHNDRKRDRAAEEREERREEKEKMREDSSATRRHPPLPPPPLNPARRPSLPTPPPPHIPRSASPLPHPPHSHAHTHGPPSPQPPPPPPPPPQPPPSFHLRHVPHPPPRSSLPVSLKNKPTRERQNTIHQLLSRASSGKTTTGEPTSISSPEYEFSDAESSTRSQPTTPSSARQKRERETPAELVFGKEAVTCAAQDTLPPRSSLTSSLQQSAQPTYTRQTRTGLLTSAAIKGQKVKLTVFLPLPDMCMWLEVGASSAAEFVCRVVVEVYRKENSGALDARMLDSVRCYQLFIAEEDGSVDDDCPGLDPSAVIGSTGSTHFALRHVGEPVGMRSGQPRDSPTLSSHPRPSISHNSMSLSDERTASANLSRAGSADGSVSPSLAVRQPAGMQEQTSVGAGMGAFETESGEALVQRPWYAKLLCCGSDEEGWADGLSRRRRSRGESVGGIASSNMMRNSSGLPR